MNKLGGSRQGLWPSRLAGLRIEREHLLPLYLLMVVFNSLLFYWIPPGYYDPRANLLHAGLVMLMLPWSRSRVCVPVIVHLATLCSLVLMLYITAHSGGVNSTGMVWLSVLAVAVLLLSGPRHTLPWTVIILGSILFMQLAMRLGWVDAQTHTGARGVPWTMMNYVLATCNLLLVVLVSEQMHLQQLRELDDRTAQLESTHRQLIQARAHKDEFVAAVGHELRTPMNAILGLNGVLRKELADQPEHVEVVDHIRRSTTQLLQVVNDILDFSQLQAGKLLLHPVDYDLPELLRQVFAIQAEKAQAKGLTLQLQVADDVPQQLHGDRLRMQQVLQNLLDNAIKFTSAGHVHLGVSAQKGHLRVEVRDTGRGIALDRQQHIFNRFEHADVQTTRAFGGTGLGLTLCERLITLQGGKIGVVSQPDQGALFWFEVPLIEARQPQAQQTPDDLLVNEALRILVVDDNAVNLMVARLQLQKAWPRAEITTVSQAAQALELLDRQAFDVALVDMIMPEMDGMQLTRHIRRHFPAITARMPIIALTANTNPVERERCLEAGMDAVVHKPMDMQTLMHCVSTHVFRARG